ncbi:MAG: hypothetical protein R3B09_04625 [Nannocystaceae bacterium]
MNGDMNGRKLDCTFNVCGDGKVGPGEGDDGNQVDDDECSAPPASSPPAATARSRRPRR